MQCLLGLHLIVESIEKASFIRCQKKKVKKTHCSVIVGLMKIYDLFKLLLKYSLKMRHYLFIRSQVLFFFFFFPEVICCRVLGGVVEEFLSGSVQTSFPSVSGMERCEFCWPEHSGPEAYSLGFFSVLMV